MNKSKSNPFLRLLQRAIGLLGLLFLLIGGLRVGVEIFGFQNLGVVFSPQLFTFSTFLVGLVYLGVGYGAIFTWAALGASEPPALVALRSSLLGFVAAGLATLLWGIFSSWQGALLGLLLTLASLGAGWWVWLQVEDQQLWKVFGQPIYRDSNISPLFYMVAIIGIMLLVALGVIEALLTSRIELPPQSPRPGDLLYLSNFEDFNDEWNLPRGRQAAAILDSELILTEATGVSDVGFYALLESRRFGDFDLRVTTRKIGGDIGHAHGIIFRWRDFDNYFLFEISNDGYYRLTKVRESIAENLTPWTESSLIRTGMSQNEVAITARDDVFMFYINGRLAQLCTKGENRQPTLNPLTGECISNERWEDRYIDSDFRQGKIGLSVGTVEGSDLTEPVVVGFDNVLVMGP